jgi:hypothetical protein
VTPHRTRFLEKATFGSPAWILPAGLLAVACGSAAANPTAVPVPAIATGTPITRPASPAGFAALAETITDTGFSRAELQAPAGQPISLLVVNRGSTPTSLRLLNVRDTNGQEIGTPRLRPGASWSLVFTIAEPGTYTFRDDLHIDRSTGALTIK